MGYVFRVDALPISLNRLMRMHWSQRKAERAFWEMAIRSAMNEQSIPMADQGERRRLAVRLIFPDRRRRDLDNYLKVLLDACTRARLIDDDNVDSTTWTVSADVVPGESAVEFTVDVLRE